jgi:hypothetical protein
MRERLLNVHGGAGTAMQLALGCDAEESEGSEPQACRSILT